MKVRLKSNSSRISYGIFLAGILMILSISSSLAGGNIFQVGKKYNVRSMAFYGKILILEKPDKLGFVKAKALDKNTRKEIGEKGFVNLSLIHAAREIK